MTEADEANDEDLSAAGVGLFAGVERLEKKEPMIDLIGRGVTVLEGVLVVAATPVLVFLGASRLGEGEMVAPATGEAAP